MKGYKYDTKEDAIGCRSMCASFKGLPLSSDSITRYWIDFNYSELDGFYYMLYEDGMEVLLGEPVIIVLTNQESIY